MFGKACNILLSAGLAPNNDATWQLLLSKQPSCPPPFVPQVSSTPISVEPDFNILGALHSFPKGTALGLRVQHLLDAASIIPLPTSTCSSLRDIVSLLASCKVPTSLSLQILSIWQSDGFDQSKRRQCPWYQTHCCGRIDYDDDCPALLFNAWFLDNGVLADKKSPILCALFLIETLGPPLGLHTNLSTEMRAV